MQTLQDAVFGFAHEAGSYLLIVTSLTELLQRDANLTPAQRADLVRVHQAAMDLHQHVRTLRGHAESETAPRDRAEVAHEQLAHDLGERVKELRLLHATARVLQETRPFDRSVLNDLVTMMPAAWKHSACCEARITYEDVSVATTGWRESRWRQSAAFT